ncbi:zinc metallopeptidase [Desulfoluna spongiiphila]|uniref:Zinc metallopeptidase n=1 Tax=Desulfoluna spongiiphila TaxID=419481 RepID=A0A1G5GMP2_9BACT|nr:zinc metallopeptidase [Desulfoluna spongiiphila]SCY52852.1 hypothetical protein SAMN05216233_11114 [Desulfoluna spongiiphila]VVS92790.1 putative neutral zinc metallopeptidase [Desulfoluna spongiiphila]
MILLVAALLILVILFGPQAWARYTLARYNRDAYFSGTGSEFARLLIEELGLKGVTVAVSPLGDHYDPEQKSVGLRPAFAEGRTLSAVVVAAHEVAHALQHARGYPPLLARGRLIRLANAVDRCGTLIFIVFPLVGIVLKAPFMGRVILVGAGILLLMPVLVHLVTLPVEFDASFNRALPLLKSGPYIPEEDLPAARRILVACALTYVAAALAGFFNVWRWARVLRR